MVSWDLELSDVAITHNDSSCLRLLQYHTTYSCTTFSGFWCVLGCFLRKQLFFVLVLECLFLPTESLSSQVNWSLGIYTNLIHTKQPRGPSNISLRQELIYHRDVCNQTLSWWQNTYTHICRKRKVYNCPSPFFKMMP